MTAGYSDRVYHFISRAPSIPIVNIFIIALVCDGGVRKHRDPWVRYFCVSNPTHRIYCRLQNAEARANGWPHKRKPTHVLAIQRYYNIIILSVAWQSCVNRGKSWAAWFVVPFRINTIMLSRSHFFFTICIHEYDDFDDTRVVCTNTIFVGRAHLTSTNQFVVFSFAFFILFLFAMF